MIATKEFEYKDHKFTITVEINKISPTLRPRTDYLETFHTISIKNTSGSFFIKKVIRDGLMESSIERLILEAKNYIDIIDSGSNPTVETLKNLGFLIS